MCRVNAGDKDALADLMDKLERQIHVYRNWTPRRDAAADLERNCGPLFGLRCVETHPGRSKSSVLGK